VRIALCIVGGLRTFLLPPVHESIRRQLIAPHPPGSVDVFFFLTLHHRALTDSRGQPLDLECSASPLRAVLDSFSPRHVSLWKNASSCKGGVRFGAESCAACEGGAYREAVYVQTGWVNQCFEAARREEARAGANYTHFIRTRPDLFIGGPLPRWAFEPRHQHVLWTAHKYAPGSDLFFVASAHLMARWWEGGWRKRGCLAVEDRSPEYVLFAGLREAEPDQRARCGDRVNLADAACADEPLPDVEPPGAPPGADPLRLEVVVKKLLQTRVVLVRSTTVVSCWWAGFWCRPADQDALLAQLSHFSCGATVM
jgi:hypothetical protein